MVIIDKNLNVRRDLNEAFDYKYIPMINEPFSAENIPPGFHSIQEVPANSVEFRKITTYLHNTCDPHQSQIKSESVRIYRYSRGDENLTQFENANWLLWTGVRSQDLDSIKKYGLKLPSKPQKALFFTPCFSLALQHTDAKEIKKLNDQRKPGGKIYVLLCEVAVGKPFFAKSRRLCYPIISLDDKEFAERQNKFKNKFRHVFPVTRYQESKARFEDGDFMSVDEVIDFALTADFNSVYTCNSSQEPKSATIWKGRILPDGELVERSKTGEIDSFMNCQYSELFVWDANQVSIRYIVELKANLLGFIE